MISLSIDRSSLGLTPLPLVDSGRTAGTYVVTADGWAPGAVIAENDYAQSRWLDGGQIVSTRREIVTMSLVVRLWASTLPGLTTMVDTLAAALGQRSYTITETGLATLPRTWSCFAASVVPAYDPVQLRQFTTIVTASIPRQP